MNSVVIQSTLQSGFSPGHASAVVVGEAAQGQGGVVLGGSGKGLVLHNMPHVTLTISESALMARADAISKALACPDITSDPAEAIGYEVLGALETVLRDMETSRKEVKDPVNKLADHIQDRAKQFSADLLQHKDRISKALGAYKDIKDAAVRKLEQERLAELQKQAEAAQKAMQATVEASKALEGAKDGKDAQAAQTALLQAKEAQERANALVVQNSVPVKAGKVKGGAVRKTWSISDIDVQTLYAKRPDLCDIVPNEARIKAALDLGQVEGVTALLEAKAHTRK